MPRRNPSPTADDLARLTAGTHRRLHHFLGAHLDLAELSAAADGASSGATVSVWAPRARAVTVVGDFNDWSPGAAVLEPVGDDTGVWSGRLDGVRQGQAYKLAVTGADGETVLHADPFAIHTETPPSNASKLWSLDYDWGDGRWLAERAGRQRPEAPMAIYEVHLGSWQRGEDGRRFLTYRELAAPLIEHVQRLGFTHVELLPVMEHPFYGSWGYQTTGYFAPTSRYGTPQDLMGLIDQLHQADIGVILDWVPSHFPDDWWGLSRFDGQALFEHADPRRGRHPDWNSAMFDYGRPEVRAFLISSALFWIEQYHADGLRMDAVSSMLTLDYSRNDGEWEPNIYGGNEYLEGTALLRALNQALAEEAPGVLRIAEEVTAWPGVTAPVEEGGLGFDLTWDVGWMHDTLAYHGQPFAMRAEHHGRLTFRSVYQANESFCLPLSHDEVSHTAGSLLSRLPGDDHQQRAGLRVLLGQQLTAPGKPLLFMGSELGQRAGWDVDAQLDWGLLHDERHAGIVRWVADLTHAYRQLPALHVGDARAAGFRWIDAADREQAVLSWLREAPGQPPVLVVVHLLPTTLDDYRIGVPTGGYWREVANSDARVYGGSGQGNQGGCSAEAVPAHGHGWSLSLCLPPLSVLLLAPE